MHLEDTPKLLFWWKEAQILMDGTSNSLYLEVGTNAVV